MSTYANTADRDAAIATVKQQCRDLLAGLDALYPGEIAYSLTWIDGVWGDYWYVTRNGEQVGDLYYDGHGPCPKGDALGQLLRRADIAAERAAALLASTEHGHCNPTGTSRCDVNECTQPDTHLVRPTGSTPRPAGLAAGDAVCVCTEHAKAFRRVTGFEVKRTAA